MNNPMNDKILEVRDMKKYFPVTRGLLRRKAGEVKAVDSVTFHMKKGETLGLVGESGSGKTTVGRCILRLYEPTGGRVVLDGKDITHLPEKEVRKLRRKMAMVFQDPCGSLDPRQNAGNIVGEPLKIHGLVSNKREYLERVKELFHMVGLDPQMIDRVQHEFSGGQRQRIGIARAIAVEPSLIVCDEPVSAFDVSIQAQILNLLEDLKEKVKGLSYLFIAHDLSVVKHISDRIAVMYFGRIVEITDKASLYENPLHPYTKVLLSAIPIPDPFVEEKRQRIIVKGEVPSPLNPPHGCPFCPRCPEAIAECREVIPELKNVGGDHQVACIRI